MSAAGKSTIGVVIAKRLGFEFLDSDLLIQKRENALLSEIIEKNGIEGFLEIENQVNLGINVENTVIAPGGSVVYCKEAMEHLKENGELWLVISKDQGAKSLLKDLAAEYNATLVEKNKGFYIIRAIKH